MPTHDPGDQPNGAHASDSFQDLRYVAGSIGLVSLGALLLTAWYGAVRTDDEVPLQVLWAVAIWCSAAGLGFLFAIPRVLQTPPNHATPAAPATTSGAGARAAARTAGLAYQQRVNTNLEEISDWLTKIIVGIALVQLRSFPPYVDALANQVTANLASLPGRQGFGIAIVVVFSALGFLFGYLVTRLYIQGALLRAERGLADPAEYERLTQLAQNTSTLLAEATRTVAPGFARARPSEAVVQELNRLGDAYMSVNVPDWSARVKAKNQAAAELFMAAAKNGVSKDWLAAQTAEPLALALSAWVQAASEPGDAARLLKVGSDVKRKHVQYWLTQALGRLADQNLMTPTERTEAARLLDSYAKGADAPLLGLVDAVRKRL